jgi:hypothetical protein
MKGVHVRQRDHIEERKPESDLGVRLILLQQLTLAGIDWDSTRTI